MATMRYVVVVEQVQSGFGAYVPDLPGCVAAADTRAEVVLLIEEAIELHIEDLRERSESVPAPSSSPKFVEVCAA